MKTIALCLLGLVSLNAFSATDRPFPNTSEKKTNQMCTAWAKSEKKMGVNTIVVAFEGLMTFKTSATKRLYKYQDELRAGKNVEIPKRTSMAFLAQNLLARNMEEIYDKAAVLVLPHSGEGDKNSVGYNCTMAFNKVFGKKLNIIIVGHSFGGPAGKRLMAALNDVDVTVKGMISLDPRLKQSDFYTRPNVERHEVYFQKGVMRGYPFKDERGEEYTTNTHIPGRDISGPEGIPHANITYHSMVREAFLRMVLD